MSKIEDQDARAAIDGAIAFGRMGVNEPPAGHWLTEYWSIGRQLAELGKTSAWDNQTPVESRPTPEQSRETRCDVGHAHFTPFYLLANARRIVSREYSRKPNWALAMDLFAVGSTTAIRICREAGIDPDGTTVTRAAMDRSALGREESDADQA